MEFMNELENANATNPTIEWVEDAIDWSHLQVSEEYLEEIWEDDDLLEFADLDKPFMMVYVLTEEDERYQLAKKLQELKQEFDE